MELSSAVAKIKKYMKLLNDESTVEKGLHKLEGVDMTIELLTETKVGKAVQNLSNDKNVGDLAYSIVKGWKKIAKRAGYEESKSRKNRESPDTTSSGSNSSSIDKPDEDKKKERKEKEIKKAKKPESSKSKDQPESSSSGNHSLSFEEMLALGDKAPEKKRKLDIFPPLDMNYKPIRPPPPRSLSGNYAPNHEKEPEEEFDLLKYKYKSSERQRVFAGRKKASGKPGVVDSLFIQAQRMVIANLDYMTVIPHANFIVLKTILERANPRQLLNIEYFNPELAEDTDCLWEAHFKKIHPGWESYANETWKQGFFRVEKEKEQKLKQISNRIKHQDDGLPLQRKTALVDPLAPRNIRRKQYTHNTVHVSKPIPHALEVSKARKEIFESGSKDKLQSLPSSVRNLHSTVGASKGFQKKQPVKKGTLMAKTMKMLNMKKRR